jgi:hypothetical protein
MDMGVPPDIRAEICGHSEAVNLRVYSHARMEAKRSAVSNLDALFAGAFDWQSVDKATDKAKQPAEVVA